MPQTQRSARSVGARVGAQQTAECAETQREGEDCTLGHRDILHRRRKALIGLESKLFSAPLFTQRDKRVKTIPRLQPHYPSEVTMSESVIVII